ncbi:MAG: hypothetical protein AAGJ10_15125 [Bacteroidota bacterium]
MSACDESLTPISGEVDGYYTINGYLDVDADTQFVRVTPVRFQFERLPAEPLEARVFTRNLSTGVETTWQDSLITLDDGTTDHLFHSTALVTPGDTYEFVIERPDGIVVRTQQDVPPIRPILPAGFEQRQVGNNLDAQFFQDVALRGLNVAPDDLTMRYRYINPATAQPDSLAISYVRIASDEGVPTGDSWTVPIQLSDDRFSVLNSLGVPANDTTIVLLGLSIDVVVLSRNWRSNVPRSFVQNGYGFFGARTRYQRTWQLTREALSQLGFESADG